MELLYKQIQEALASGLPGSKAQLKLAPEGRTLTSNTNNTTSAAVLILLYRNKDGEYQTVFMKRTSYKGHHSAQISFPGGKSEPSDGTLANTALRETEEEIGVPSSLVKLLGKITELYIPVSNFQVHPFIGTCSQKIEFLLDKSEVEYIITTPLKDLVKTPILYTTMQFEGDEYNVPFYSIKDEIVWGATAMILSEFIEVLHHPAVKELM